MKRRSTSDESNGTSKKRKSAIANGNEDKNGQVVATNGKKNGHAAVSESEQLVHSTDPLHPANHICELCRKFYDFGWVTGTGGGVSIRHGEHVFIAPSGVQKELLRPTDMFVMEYQTKTYLRKPLTLKPSACTPLFLAAFEKRNAYCCIHTHSQWAVLVTLISESGQQNSSSASVFSISQIEQIKGISRGGSGSDEIAEGGRKVGNLGFFDTLRVPIIDNTAHEEDLRDTLAQAIDEWPEACAVLVRRHGVYVWGKDVAQAKTQCESLDYLFQLAVEMHRLGMQWVK